MTPSKPSTEPVPGRAGLDGDLVMGYSLLMILVQIGVGIVHGASRAVLEWLPESLALKFTLIAAASFAVYWMMAHRHPAQFFVNGALVAAVTGLVGAMFALLLQFSNASAIVLFAGRVAAHMALFVIAYVVLRSLAVVGPRSVGNNGA